MSYSNAHENGEQILWIKFQNMNTFRKALHYCSRFSCNCRYISRLIRDIGFIKGRFWKEWFKISRWWFWCWKLVFVRYTLCQFVGLPSWLEMKERSRLFFAIRLIRFKAYPLGQTGLVLSMQNGSSANAEWLK